MSAIRRFEDIEAWQAARVFNDELWKLISSGAFGRDYALVDQMNRAAGSAMDNVAEGFDSGSNAEFTRFLRYTQRSCTELKSQLYRALDRGHIDDDRFHQLATILQEVSNKTGGLIRYLTRQGKVQSTTNKAQSTKHKEQRTKHKEHRTKHKEHP